MDFTFFTLSEGFGLIVPRPGEESRLFAFVRPFQPTVPSFSTLVTNISLLYFYYDKTIFETEKEIQYFGVTFFSGNRGNWLFLIFLQVWLLILSSLVATVGMMTYFGWVYYYNKYAGVKVTGAPTNTTVTNNGGPLNNSDNHRLLRWVIWNNFSLHMLYVINIMTNQGKLPILHYGFVYVL